MNRNEFGVELSRLIDVYGEKAYPDARAELLFAWASRMTTENFKALVSNLIANYDRAPMLSKFKESFDQLGIANSMKKFECNYCNGSGFIPDDKILPTVYRCRCPLGESMSKSIQQWKGMLIRIVPTTAELDWRNALKAVREAAEKMEMNET